MSHLRKRLLDEGYAIVPGLLDGPQRRRLRTAIDRHFAAAGNIFKLGMTQPNAAVMMPDVTPVLHDPRVIRSFRHVLGTNDIVFTGHCDVHRGMFSGWHKDTGPDHGYFAEDCFAPGCEVYKMGIYLQDHRDGDGLTVVPGSHRSRTIDEAGARRLRTMPGDAVIFDVRITHRGKTSDRVDKWLYRGNQAVKIAAARLSGRPVAKDDLRAAYMLRRAWDVATHRAHRHSIFFTFGQANRFTEQFAAANWVRQAGQNRAEGELPPTLVAQLRAQDVLIAEAIRSG